MRYLLLVTMLLVVASAAHAEMAQVTYVTSKSFYLDAGQAAGLAVGGEVEVIREDAVVATGRVTEVTNKRAICTWTDPAFTPVVGDAVRFTAVEHTAAVVTGSGGPNWFDRMGLHGRIGLQTLHIRDRSDFGSDFDRPALNVRLRGQRIGGTPVGTEIDVRAAAIRQSRDGDAETSSRSRIYRLNFFGGDPARGWNLNVGRQFAPSLSVIHLFDGARAEYAGRSWSAGLLAGSQPEPDFGISTSTFEGGAWLTWKHDQGVARWALTTAFVGSRADGEIDREFAWIQGRWSRHGLTLRADQVVDLNRGWKQDAGEATISSTSTYLMASWQVNRRLGLNGGLDNRRRVRFLRDRETPETEFDDSYRQGYWLGARIKALPWLNVGLNGRTRLRDDRERADSGTMTLGIPTRWWGNLRFSTRSTIYRSELVEGWLQTGRISARPHPRVTVGAFGGARSETGRINDLMDGTDPWGGADVDFSLGRSAWLSLRWESQFGGDEAFDQLWLGTGLRF